MDKNMEGKQLSVFDDGDAKMSIVELSVVLRVDESTIRKYTQRIYPGKMKNGVKTLFSEVEATAIKLELQNNPHLGQPSDLPKTDLEKELLIQQAMQFQAEKIQTLTKERDESNRRLLDAAPAIEFHEQVGDSKGLHNMAETAKLLNLGFGRNTLMKNLRETKVLMDNNAPYQMYVDLGYLELKENVVGGNDKFLKPQPFVTGKGLKWLQKRYSK